MALVRLCGRLAYSLVVARCQLDHRITFTSICTERLFAHTKSISKLTQSRPASGSPNSLNHSLQVWLQIRSIRASTCVSILSQSRLPSALTHLLNHGLQVHFQTCSITASKCISKLAQSQPPSASPHSLNHRLQAHRETRSISAS